MKCSLPSFTAGLQGSISVPGDKSITHRAIMFSSFAMGKAKVKTTLMGRDNLSTLRIMQQLGVEISGKFPEHLFRIAEEEKIKNVSAWDKDFAELEVCGKGFDGLQEPREVLDCGNSGTTARLLCGVLAGRPFRAKLCGDSSLSKRPFKRVIEPLSEMGARFEGESLPFTITGGKISGLHFFSQKASAQVKSAILLAGLQSAEEVSVTEPVKSRDHTERLLKAMGCSLEETELSDGRFRVVLKSGPWTEKLQAVTIDVPGDFSSAAFFLVAASMFPNSEVVIKNVGVNPTRLGLKTVLERMGANIAFQNERLVGGEPVADIVVKSAKLRGVSVDATDVVFAIDEIPILSVAAAVADGVTEITGAKELRVKESDRLSMVASILKSFGVEVSEREDGLVITGNPKLREIAGVSKGVPQEDTSWQRSGDHRIAMCGAIMELYAKGSFEILDSHAVETSFPNFPECFQTLAGQPK